MDKPKANYKPKRGSYMRMPPLDEIGHIWIDHMHRMNEPGFNKSQGFYPVYVRWESTGKDELVCYVRWKHTKGCCTIIDQTDMYAFNGRVGEDDKEGEGEQSTSQETFVQKKVSKPVPSRKAKGA